MNSGPSGFRSSLPFQGNLSEFPPVSWVYEGSRRVRWSSSGQEKLTTQPAPGSAALKCCERWWTSRSGGRWCRKWKRRGCVGDFLAKAGLSCLSGEKLVFAKVMQGKEPEPDLLEGEGSFSLREVLDHPPLWTQRPWSAGTYSLGGGDPCHRGKGVQIPSCSTDSLPVINLIHSFIHSFTHSCKWPGNVPGPRLGTRQRGMCVAQSSLHKTQAKPVAT